MNDDFDPAHLTTIRNAIARIGAADMHTFGLVWEDCEQLLSKLGDSAQVNIVARQETLGDVLTESG